MYRSPAPDARPYVHIVEQPASKALRFRYECEGRSAGSIPGINSTPERRTYPTIEIVGHKGRAIIVVSCVTKDKPYKPHPHNLVGRDLCKKGVCTVNVSPDTNVVTFSNLGIQCVKRRDIAEALRVREDMRVDPFKTGFAHKNQPQSIDLNAVRLCFQVFLPDENGKVRHALPPVVSDVIYDKKAMSDLTIVRVSRCSGPVKGGTELILLCEKVTREDTAVVFFQKENGKKVWEATANIILVHKQVAIAFYTPPYENPNSKEHVQVYIQLRRLSDDMRSVPVPFEYFPDYAGTKRKPLPDLSLLSILLSEKRTDGNNNDNKPLLDKNDVTVSSTSDTVSGDASDESGSAAITDTHEPLELEPEPHELEPEPADTNERSLNELLDQVAELDEIYSENRTRLENVSSLNNDETDLEDFNDAGTYTSLQLAFKNPVPIAEPEALPYEDVQVITYRGPTIEFAPLKRDSDDERAPPLPPKRVRKAPSVEGFKTSQTSVDSILKPGRQLPITRNQDALNRNELTVAKSEPALPPAPKKRSFFSRLFRRKEKSPAPSVKSEGKKEKKSKPVGRSVSSVSGLRPSKFKSSVSHTSLKDNASGTGLSYADSITHISLHGDGEEKSASQTSLRRPASLAPLPPTDGGTILVAESVLALDASAFKKLQDDLDLTEAEHYALYMAVAPHATVSEFDETSCYYSPVDGNSEYLKNKKRKTMISSFLQTSYDQERSYQVEQKPIKSEPRDKTPPHQMNSPHRVFSPQYGEHEPVQEQYQWGVPLPGPSHVSAYPAQDMWAGGYAQSISPNLQTISPSLQTVSPNMQAVSPNMQAMSPNMQAMSPNMQAMSPNMQAMSPNMQAMSPNMQVMSPNMQAMSPMGNMEHGGMSPNMAAVSPNLVQPSNLTHVPPNLAQQLQQQSLMETTSSDTPSITGLLLDRADGNAQFYSGELSSLSALFGDRQVDSIDSLSGLPSGDLLGHTHMQ